MKEQVWRLEKSAGVHYVTDFVSFWLKGWNTDLGLETERHHIARFDVGGDKAGLKK